MKILICDDDINLLQVLLKQVDWQAVGIDRVLTAENGEVAKGIIEAERPQIVLSDISMPLCSGIDLIRYVREREISCEFAFLTCYAEVSYMREAMRYGAKWYLNKPVNYQELNRELKEIVAAARKKESTGKVIPSDEKLIAITILRGLRDGLYAEDRELLDQSLKTHHLTMSPDDVFRTVGVRINLKPEGEVKVRPIAVLAKKEILGVDSLESVLIDLGESRLTLTIFLPAGEADEERLLAGCRRFIRGAQEQFSLAPVCVVGRQEKLFRTFSAAEELREALHKLRFKEGKAFLLQEAASAQAGPADTGLNEETFLKLMAGGDKSGYLRCVTGSISQGTRGRSDSDAFMSRLHHILLQTGYSCVRDNGILPTEIFQDEKLRAQEASAERSSIDMMRFSEALFARVNELLVQKKASKDTVELARQYIREHYTENIDREAIAEAACVAPNYLSKLFHEKTGVSIREYINSLRMEEARRLLLTTDMAVSEVALMVGFDNISYFSTVFRKMCGVSPAEWKGRSVSLQN